MQFHLHVDEYEPPDVYFTLLSNGEDCGQLKATFAEYSALGRALLIGASRLIPPASVGVDTVLMPTRTISSPDDNPDPAPEPVPA
jgi:hypothetical protein